MSRSRPAATILAAAVLGAAIAACSIGPDEGASGGATLTVTQNFGAVRMLRASERTIPGGETVMRLLQRRAKVETRYGGRFVNAIDRVRSRGAGEGRQDWFYYVNGIEAEKGAAERDLEGGDRVWWDYRDWSAAMRVPAVVGSFPEPFIHGSEGKRFPVRIDCAQDADKICEGVADRLDRAGISPSTTALGAPAGEHVLRFVVGRWEDVRRDGAARQIEEGPQVSGVFARFGKAGGDQYELELLDPAARVVDVVGPGAGLVAATRFEEQQPTWVVTGIDDSGVERAARLLEERVLRDRFAVAATVREQPLALPVDRGQPR
jgi:hypothetical protein